MNNFIIYLTLALLSFVVATNSIARATDLESVIRKTAVEECVDPDLAVAIAKVESGMNTKKIGGLGEIGVYQLRPEFHKVSKDVRENIRTAVRYMKELRETQTSKYGDAWFIAYNVGPNYPKEIKHPRKFKYYVRVMNEKAKASKPAVVVNNCEAERLTILNQNEIIGRQAEEIEILKSRLPGGF